jgi:hypothetical protein
MAKFRSRAPVVDAVQLLWSTWEEMCEHAGVGRFEDGKPEGRLINADHSFHENPILSWSYRMLGHAGTERIGLEIPTLEGSLLAVEGDWVVKDFLGVLHVLRDYVFKANFEEVV